MTDLSGSTTSAGAAETTAAAPPDVLSPPAEVPAPSAPAPVEPTPPEPVATVTPQDQLLADVTAALAKFKVEVIDPALEQVAAAVEARIPAVEAKIEKLAAKVDSWFPSSSGSSGTITPGPVETVVHEAETLAADAEEKIEGALGLGGNEPPAEGANPNTQPSV